MWRCFSTSPNITPFITRPLLTNITAVNTKVGFWREKSEKFDFSKEDLVNDFEFNEVIWKAVKGEHSEVP